MQVPFPTPRALLTEYGLHPKKSFGQNFLSDAALVAKIARLVGPPSQVLEIGAGLGALTHALLTEQHHVSAVERDRDLVPILLNHFRPSIESGQLRVIEADAKAVDPIETLSHPTLPRVVTGNLPYQLTGPLLQMAVRASAELTRAIFLVQLEVAERLCAAVGSPEYGALTVFVNAAFDVRRAFNIKRSAFLPAPNVDSTVVVLTPRLQRIEETPLLQNLVRAAFGMRRKTLRNAWKSVAPAPTLQAAATRAGISLDARGETLSAEDFERMREALELPG